MLLFLIVNVLLLSHYAVKGKSDPKFRMEKINYIWNKASVHVKDPQVASKLQKDLANFDHLYLTIKQDGEHHKKTKNLAEVDAKLETLLRRYDLEETIHAFKMKYKNNAQQLNSEDTLVNIVDTNFIDERVIKIWDSIKSDAEITNEDLEEIRRRLIEQDNRCADYEEMLGHHKQTSDNHIHPHDEHEELSIRVKQLNQEIEDSFEQLHQRIAEIHDNPFKNQKVRHLWNKARRNNKLIPNELDVIKTELRHLDRQLDKTEYHAKHLSEHQDHLKSMGDEGNDENSKPLREHQEKLERKLKKLESYLEEKVTSIHSEL